MSKKREYKFEKIEVDAKILHPLIQWADSIYDNKELARILGMSHYNYLSNLRNRCEDIVNGKITDIDKLLYASGKNMTEQVILYLPMYAQILKQLQVFSEHELKTQTLQKATITDKNLLWRFSISDFILFFILIFLVILYIKIDAIPQVSSSENFVNSPVIDSTKNIIDSNNHIVISLPKKGEPIDECEETEKEMESCYERLSNNFSKTAKSQILIKNEIETLNSLLKKMNELGCPNDKFTNRYLIDNWFEYSFLAHHITKDKIYCKKILDEYLLKDFPKKQTTQRLFSTIQSYHNIENIIDTDSTKNVVSVLDDILDANVMKTQYFNHPRRSELQAISNTLKEQLERERVAKLKAGIVIWVYDLQSTQQSKPADIKDRLMRLGYTSVVVKEKSLNAPFTASQGYYKPKMKEQRFISYYEEIKRVCTNATWVIKADNFTSSVRTSKPVIKDKFKVNADVDIILVF